MAYKSLLDRWASEGEETFFFIDEETEKPEKPDDEKKEKATKHDDDDDDDDYEESYLPEYTGSSFLDSLNKKLNEHDREYWERRKKGIPFEKTV